MLAALFCAAPALSDQTVVEPRDGGAAWTSTERASLAVDLDRVFALAALRGAHAGLLVVDARDGAPLYARLADDDFMPASTLKLVVGSAALAGLGTAFRFHTSAALSPDGTIVLRGGGDPFLNAADMDALATKVAGARAAGAVPGVAVDSSLFDAQPYPPGWVWDDFPYDYAPVISATSYEENAVHLVVAAGDRIGAPASVSAGAWGVFRGGVQSACAPSGPLVIVVQAVTGGASTESTVDAVRTVENCIAVTGTVPLRGGDEIDAAVPDPGALAGAALLQALRRHGVAVASPIVASQPTTGSQIWAHDSSPLSDLLGRMWLPSDNLLAELLLKSLAVVHAGSPGTTDNGVAYELQYLRSLGLNPAGVTLRDGSGLSIYDRISPRDLVAVLQADWRGPNRQLVIDALPVAGVRGTLRSLFAGTAAAGHVFAKSGSMSHVRALAGYAATRYHGPLTFALLVDDYVGETAPLDALRTEILVRLANS